MNAADLREVELFGCSLHAVDTAGALKAIEKFIEDGKTHQAVFLNAAKFVEMDKNSGLADNVKRADLRLADGKGVVWAAAILGRALPERVAGVDLMAELLKAGAKKKHRFFFLGAKEEVLQKAVDFCEKEFKGIVIAGKRNGYFDEGEEELIADQIKKSRPHVLFVGISSPKKEAFVGRRLHSMEVPFVMGVGGGFDILAGATKRAPLFLQRVGLEWLYRFMQEPGRLWKRYLIGNALFIWKVVKCRLGICSCCGRDYKGGRVE